MSESVSKNIIKSLLNKELYEQIAGLYKETKPNVEYEFIFSNRIVSQEKYINLLKFMKIRKNQNKLESDGPTDTLDIVYSADDSTNYRITIEGNNDINANIKRLDMWKNHVVFSTLVKLYKEKKTKNVSLMKKVKEVEKTIDISDLDMRVRSSMETDVSKEDLTIITNIDYTQINNITFRLKQRFSVYLLKTDNEFVRVDITSTKTTKNYNRLNDTIMNYELEVEYGLFKGSPSKEAFEVMMKEIEILHKILQQSNFIITNAKKDEILQYYKTLTNANEKSIGLDARQAFSLEIQHVTEVLPDKYAVTDKADGERYFLVIKGHHVYFISNNLAVRDSGVELKNDDYDGTILDGEYIFVPKLNRHMFMAFDCLYTQNTDIRTESSFIKRLNAVDKVIQNCFIFSKQKGFKYDDFIPKKDFDLNEIINFHSKQIDGFMDSVNKDMEVEKHLPLIRRKYFIDAKGAKKWEIFRYSELLWKKYTEDATVKCPYLLDGLIFHPLEQPYVTNMKESKLTEFKWKPPHKNSIDFYIQFEKDRNTRKVLSVYDNSNDEFVRNKPYRICRLYVGKKIKFKEQPVLFREQDDMYWSYMFLNDGEIRDLDGNIISDGTVVEFYYNNDPEVSERFRWVPIRTRYDKTESVLKHGKKFGNYIDIADKVWRSIINPILMSDFVDLGKGNNPDKNLFLYDKKVDSLRTKIGHELIVSAAKENAYYQKISNIAKPLRQFHNWIKSNIIYTYCHPMYQDNKQLSVFDIACGRGGDIMKFYYASVAFYVGIDISNEGLVSAVDGAVSRYNQSRRAKPNFPKMYFIHADAGAILEYDAQYRALGGMSNENKQLIDKFFSPEQKRRTMFDRVNCQFAVHYFLKDETTWSNFKANVTNYLRNGGYFMITHFDAKRVMEAFGSNDKFTVEYTDDRGKKLKLFEIVKKFGEIDTKKTIGTSYPIDVYAAWMFEEGNYVTEYLVDIDFITKDLLETCDLELVDTDLFENQFNIHSEYFNNYCKYEENPDTHKFLKNVAEFYSQNELNEGSQKYSFLTRYSVFRKKDKASQKGGKFDFSNPQEYYVPDTLTFDTDFSCMGSIHSILRSHHVIPSSISMNDFYKDVRIKIVNDRDISFDDIKKISKGVIIQNEVDLGGKVASEIVVNGLNIFIVERDCNNDYDIDLIQKGKSTKNDRAIILMKEGDVYKPIYKRDSVGRRKGLFKMSDQLIEHLLINSDEY
jgi:hypothetical protein